MHDGNIFDITFFSQLPIFHFHIAYDSRINSDGNHNWEKRSKGIGLVKTKNKGEPVFGIVGYHFIK
jgi:hypothetical protein